MRPVIIAHRGASGHLPEHTLQAKALAFAMGADYLEQDIVATRDDRLVVLHDIHLDGVTDVASRYPDRAREDGRYYVRDFDLAEIGTLRVHERRDTDGQQVFPGRRNHDGADFRVHTLERELELVRILTGSGGRDVGIYPEIKSPVWHQEEGVDISMLVLDVLRRYGYTSHNDPVYLQCFDEHELQRIRQELGCKLKLVQLIDEDTLELVLTNFSATQVEEKLKALSGTVEGIGPPVNKLYTVEDGRIEDRGFVAKAHAQGLVVHPYTFRDDSLPPGFATIDELFEFAVGQLNIDGFFTDFPDSAARYLQRHRTKK